MYKRNIQYLLAALLLAITANLARTAQVIERPRSTLQRDRLVGENLGKIGATLKCLMHIYDAEIGKQIYRVWDGNLERVQKEAILKLTDDQYMGMVYEKVLMTLKDVQSIHSQCANVPYACGLNVDSKKLEVPKDIHDLLNNLESIGATIKCLLANNKSDPRIHRIFAQSIARYHGSHASSKTSLVVTKEETSHLVAELKKLETRCQMSDMGEEPCPHPSIGAQPAVEPPLNTLQRDRLVGENLGKIGTTLKCLTYIFDAEIGEKIYRTWDGNLERVQTASIVKLNDDQYMNLLDQKVMITLKEVQSIHPHCANIPYSCEPNEHSKKLQVPNDILDLQNNLETMGATIKCLLANNKSDPRIHSIFAQSITRYHGSHTSSKTSLVVTKEETSHLVAELKKLETRCQMSDIGEEPCPHPSIGAQPAVEPPLNTLQRDRLVGENLGKIGTTLKCLTYIFDAEIGEKIYRTWDGNLERVQTASIVKLNDDQYMNLLDQKVMITLKEVQSIHPHCANIPYSCEPNEHSKKLQVPNDILDLQNNLETMGATIKCLLANNKSDPRIHSIFAQSITRYHGSHTSSKTSLVVTKEETSHLVAELKKLDSLCQMVKIDEEPCFHTLTGAQPVVEPPLTTLQRDRLVGENLGKVGTILTCLMNVFDAEIGEKIYRAWDGNLERVQKEAILKLTDDQYMGLVHDKVLLTLRAVQSIHPQCTGIPYACDLNVHSKKAQVPQDIYELQNNLENMGATIKCLLINNKPDPRIHNIFAKGFVRYHGNRETTKTSLAVTTEETTRLLSELRKLDTRCQKVKIVEEPCSLPLTVPLAAPICTLNRR